LRITRKNYEPSLPVSEKSNPLTRGIDRASASSIVRMLQACDAQMFQEETGAAYQRLLSEQVVTTLMEVAKKVELILKDPEDSLVILSGCGTSGRLAFLITSRFNRALRQLNHSPVYSYVIAGGDRSLLSSQEAPEDDPKLGMLSLKKVCEGKKRVLFIGISCGLSAPFVAGQLEFCLQNPEVYTPVLVGFNPAHQARDEPLPGCTFTFRSVVQRMEELAKSQQAFLINPAVGPEAISGSSRMKGGSTTKILLEVVLSAAHAATFSHAPTYLCVLDYEDVRGFVSGGYRELSNKEGPLTSLGAEFCIAHEDFLHLVLPCLTDKDTVLLVYTHSDDVSKVVDLARRVREKTSNLHAVYHQADGDTSRFADKWTEGASEWLNPKRIIPFLLKSIASLSQQWELSTKLVLNAVSTGAHVLKGKIYQNYMIDVQVTNSKLYRRATRLLQKLSSQPESQCEEALLKAIYQVDELTLDITSSDVITHTCTAATRTKVVPLALVCLLTGCSLDEAESRLERQPIVREAVEALLS
uniref:Glucokinase regulator n=1 Tax=Stegastes partitus TaxID=144197 RepID=A0A3B5A8Q8_9TELE